MRKESLSNSHLMHEFQEHMLRGIHAIEKDHVVARGYEKYNEGWDHALARVRALLEGVVKDLTRLAAEDETVNPTGAKTDTVQPEHDPINHPSHYTDGGIETLDYILAKKMDFLTGQVCKYISRFGKKNSSKAVEDLKKAQFYLNRKIAEMKKGEKTKAQEAQT